jgi:hypothetical protein
MVVIDVIRSVMPVAALLGRNGGPPPIEPGAFATAVVGAAAAGGRVPELPGDIGRLADGTWACQFPSTVPPSVVTLKLAILRETWGVTIEQSGPTQLVLRRVAGGGGLFGGKKYGLEASILLPDAVQTVGEMTVLGRTFGTPDQKTISLALDLLPKLLSEVRTQLGNVQDRRRHPRVACELSVTLYPVHSDGGIDAAVPARCCDASRGGVGLITETALSTKYVYATFDGIAATAGQAVLLRLVRVQPVGTERRYGAQYRTDL